MDDSPSFFENLHDRLVQLNPFWSVVFQACHRLTLELKDSTQNCPVCFCCFNMFHKLSKVRSPDDYLNLNPKLLSLGTYQMAKNYKRDYAVDDGLIARKKMEIKEYLNGKDLADALTDANSTSFKHPIIQLLLNQLRILWQDQDTDDTLDYDQLIVMLSTQDPCFLPLFLHVFCVLFNDPQHFLSVVSGADYIDGPRFRNFIAACLDQLTHFKVDWRGLFFSWSKKQKQNPAIDYSVLSE